MPDLPYPIQQHCAVFHNDTVYIIGGKGDDSLLHLDVNDSYDVFDTISFSSVYAYQENNHTKKWEKRSVTNLKNARHDMACGFWKKNVNEPKIVVAGGKT